ncbi:hypothetical protein GNI_025710 [Gregarina niphandrodes]|uniref:Uncharacterized protein n=1 Tax=Gregarina niphandrodes TaxID=110365 RepID=A0A023BBE0_GRENI|nr:hypothetical protein GNI_025710 [Gregarina niphandrodes]EZG79515.1 hypothetical protein GNI_025710 [Gregarina niphandrodes]|eukprot:XP_011134421.1 hypothetical protein GNI_025710 [Gregarina niphandrodes]
MARATKDERATLATVIRILDEKSDPRWGDRLQRARNLVDETTVDIETLIDKWYCVGGLPAVQDLMAAERELLDTTWPRSGPLLDFIDDLRKLISLACNLRHRLGHPPWYYSEVVAQRIRLTAPQGAVVPTDLTQLSDLLEWMT